ncbi:MAG: bacteriochlorophyll 4-vinyl reductase [Pseudomonadota bacterium]
MASHAQGLIGPNAILQMLPVLDRHAGIARRAQLLSRAGIAKVPDGQSMIPEEEAARLHQQVRREDPDNAPALSKAAGRGTADYIMAHRIPSLAQTLLKSLPASLAATLLSKAIKKHAWTFAGSGAFHVISPWHFAIESNPLIQGERSDTCLCDWHAAVFTRLYQSLVAPDCYCKEIQCRAQPGKPRCEFLITRAANPARDNAS